MDVTNLDTSNHCLPRAECGDALDEPIPSAQPRKPRSPDLVRDPPARAASPPARAASPPARAASPPADSDSQPDPRDSEEDLLLKDDDLAKLYGFRTKWTETFSCEHSWADISDLCLEFASQARELAQYLNRSSSSTLRSQPNPPAPPRPPPPRRRPPHDRGCRRSDPAEARRIQGLYRHLKKRAARKLLNDAAVPYFGSKLDAETYFETIFAEKQCNTTLLSEALKADVPDDRDDDSTRDLKNPVSESEVAAKLRSAANTTPGADRVEYPHVDL